MRCGIAGTAAVVLAVVTLAGCATTPLVDSAPASPGATTGASSSVRPSPSTAPPTDPVSSSDVIDLPLTGTLPRSVVFAGINWTVTAARVTNLEPYALRKREPGPDLFAELAVTAANPMEDRVRYIFDDEVFRLRTWSGQEIRAVHPLTGNYWFGTMSGGATAEDVLFFNVRDPTILDGAALLIGRPPEVRAILPLTAPSLPLDYPLPIVADGPDSAVVGEIVWRFVDGSFGVDAPAGFCCPSVDARATDRERFVSVTIEGLVSGSRLGRASTSTTALRLLADGVELAAKPTQGAPGIAEGATFQFFVHWLVPTDVESLDLLISDTSRNSGTIALSINR